jgi:hypothetical protein
MCSWKATIIALNYFLMCILTIFQYTFLESATIENVYYCSRELGLQEAMCLQKEGDATSTYERIKSLQEEIENYK